jgi:hypothetical protein
MFKKQNNITIIRAVGIRPERRNAPNNQQRK